MVIGVVSRWLQGRETFEEAPGLSPWLSPDLMSDLYSRSPWDLRDVPEIETARVAERPLVAQRTLAQRTYVEMMPREEINRGNLYRIVRDFPAREVVRVLGRLFESEGCLNYNIRIALEATVVFGRMDVINEVLDSYTYRHIIRVEDGEPFLFQCALEYQNVELFRRFAIHIESHEDLIIPFSLRGIDQLKFLIGAGSEKISSLLPKIVLQAAETGKAEIVECLIRKRQFSGIELPSEFNIEEKFLLPIANRAAAAGNEEILRMLSTHSSLVEKYVKVLTAIKDKKKDALREQLRALSIKEKKEICLGMIEAAKYGPLIYFIEQASDDFTASSDLAKGVVEHTLQSEKLTVEQSLNIIESLHVRGVFSNDDLLLSAIKGAIEERNKEVLFFFNERGVFLDETILGQALVVAMSRGYLSDWFIRQFPGLSTAKSISEEDFVQAVLGGKSGVGAMEDMLSDFVLSDETRNNLIIRLSEQGNPYPLEGMLNWGGRGVDPGILALAVRASITDASPSATKCLLSEGRSLDEGSRPGIIITALESERGYYRSDFLRAVLSEGHSCDDPAAPRLSVDGLRTVLGHFQDQGTEGRLINSLSLLCRWVEPISDSDVERIIRPIIRAIIDREPQRMRETEETYQDILDDFRDRRLPVVRPTETPFSHMTAHLSSEDVYLRLASYDEVKADPLTFLTIIAEEGFHRRIFLENNPRAIDAGGLTKQFISVLIEALLEKGLVNLSPERMPLVPDDSDEKKRAAIEVLEKLGAFYRHIVLANRDRTDKLVVGQVLNVSLFELVKNLETAETFDAKQKATAVVLKKILPKSFETQMDVVLDSSKKAVKDYAEIMGLTEDEAFEEASQAVAQYQEGAAAFSKGLGDLSASIGDPVKFAQGCQGKSVTKEGLITALNEGSHTSPRVEWVKEWIESADEKSLQDFVLAITGSVALAPGSKINVKTSSLEFAMHTCFNTIDVPNTEMSKEAFFAALSASICGADVFTRGTA